jgi:prolipoprotein diacylglyceryl transferase
VTIAATIVGSIPSPSNGVIRIWKLQLHAYGLMIALGVVAAVTVFGRRLEQRGIGRKDDASQVAIWGVIGGVIGARAYHVITNPENFKGRWIDAFKIWQGGLGIWGGIALGIVTGIWGAKRRGLPIGPTLACAVPGLPIAQAIGRWGNWWNQELYGRATTLPWKLRITAPNAETGASQVVGYFHPTFLYESLWNVALFVFLLRVDRKRRQTPGRLLAMYVAGYTFARFFIEGMRTDFANKIAGLRINTWVSMILFVVSVAYLLRTRGRVAEVALASQDSLPPDADVPDADVPDADVPDDELVTSSEMEQTLHPE